MKYYITKYAFTAGILEVDGELVLSGKYVRYKNGRYLCALGKEAFESLEEAKKRVRIRAASKVAALERKLSKVRPIAQGADVLVRRSDDESDGQ